MLALSSFFNSCILRICVSRRAYSFRNNSICNRVCSRRDSTNSFWTSCSALFCASVRCCKLLMHFYWESTWISFLARSDLSWFSKWFLLPAGRVPFKFYNSTYGFSVHHVIGETMQPVSQKLYDLLMNNETLVHLPLSWTTIASGFPEALWAYSDEVSNFFISPSSRSESAMLSIDSSKCIWDWR